MVFYGNRFSRNNVVIVLPQSVIDRLPEDSYFDGEIWYALFILMCIFSINNEGRNGRGNYQESARILGPIKNMAMQK